MAFEQKDGCFACFSKTSKAGGQYFRGDVTLEGKQYNISIFEKTTVRGDRYLSGIIDEQKSLSATQTVTKTNNESKKEDSFNSDFLDDEIPF